MPVAGFEPAVPPSAQSQTQGSDRAATGVGKVLSIRGTNETKKCL